MNKLICIKTCDNCGGVVEIRHKQRLDRKNFFCSKKCEGEFRKKQVRNDDYYYNCSCVICGKKLHIKPYQLKKTKRIHCSKQCLIIDKKEYYMKGKNNHQYGLKGDLNSSWMSDRKITNYGYVKIRVLDHPYRDCDGFVFEHRLIAEKYLLTEENSIEINGKKYLKKEYSVHHIDENKLNNSLENLIVMKKSEHMSLHAKKRKTRKK